MQVALGSLQTRVAEDLLHVADVGTGVERVCGIGVPQAVRRHHSGETTPLSGCADGALDVGV
jgi:hypothetical protein